MNDLGFDLSEKLNERKNEEEKEFDFLLKTLNKRLIIYLESENSSNIFILQCQKLNR